MNGNFQVGDVVQLKSGGPKMTVSVIRSDDDGRVECAWFDDKGVERGGVYQPALLKMVGEPTLFAGGITERRSPFDIDG